MLGNTKLYTFLNLCLLLPVESFVGLRYEKCLTWSNNNLLPNNLQNSIHPELVKPGGIQKRERYATKEFDISALESLERCKTTSQAQKILEKVLTSEQGKDDNKNRQVLFKSIAIPTGASTKGISDGDLAIQTRLANKKYKITELIELNGNRDIDRASVSVFSITVASVFASIAVNQNLPGPDIIRFILVWLITFAPLAFIGYGLKDASKLQTTLVNIQRLVFPAYRKRMIQHEAGHFLVGYLLGWPIARYQTNAIRNAVEFYPLSETDRGQLLAQQLGFDKQTTGKRLNEEPEITPTIADVPFFSPEGRGALLLLDTPESREKTNTSATFAKLPSNYEPKNAWPYRGFDERTLDQLTVISLAGVCSEILAFGNAEGGVADLNQLKLLFNSAENEMPEREQENRIRYAIGYTMSQLRLHLGVLDDLAAVMDRGGSVAECIVAIENCTNPSGQDGIMGDYEQRRRQKFKSEGLNVLELLFLGNDRNIDTEENRLVEGKGGGSRKEIVRLTGDDPLYAAIAVALVFLVWASSGGISLH